MKVYEHTDPDSLRPRSHPWTDGQSNASHRYYDFSAQPELIRSSLEDLQEWNSEKGMESLGYPVLLMISQENLKLLELI